MSQLTTGQIRAHAEHLQTNEAFRAWFLPIWEARLKSIEQQILDTPKKHRGLRAQRELLIEITEKVSATATMKPQVDPPNEIPG